MHKWLYAVWVGAEVLLLISVGGLWIAAPEYTMLNAALTVFTLILGLLLLYPRRVDFVTWLKSRQSRVALTQFTGMGLVLAIVALINHVGWKFPLSADFSQQQLHTLSAQTRTILKQAPAGLRLTYFARKEDWPQGMAILRLFRAARSDIQLDAVDVEASPQRARAAGVTENGSVELSLGKKKVVFFLKDELSITNALLKLSRPRALRIYLTTGHGEAQCQKTGEEGISAFCEHLKNQLYETVGLDLSIVKEVPQDADLVVVWGPTTTLLDVEIQRLQRWMERGGSLMLLLSPTFQHDDMVKLRNLILPWGLKLNNDLIIDRLSTLETNEATIPLVTKYDPRHPVTRGFTARTLFPLSASVDVVTPVYDGVATRLLAFTSEYPGAWAEKDLAGVANGKATFNDGVDIKGPVALVGVSERLSDKVGEKDTRLAVIGNDVFARNAYRGQAANMNLLLNLTSWLAHDEGLVSLNRPHLNQGGVVLGNSHLRLVFFIAVITIPLLAFAIAVLIYRRRRRL